MSVSSLVAEQKQIDLHKDFKPHEKYRNIIFDVGNVLLRWDVKKILAALFPEPGAEAFFAIMQSVNYYENKTELTPEQMVWRDYNRGLVTLNELLDLWQAKCRRVDAHMFFTRSGEFLDPIPEGMEILHAVKAKGYKVYLLTNTVHEHYEMFKYSDFFKLVDGVTASHLVHVAKPEPEIYHKLLEMHGLSAQECLFIDDLEANVTAGKACDIDGIVCKNHTDVLLELKKLKVLD